MNRHDADGYNELGLGGTQCVELILRGASVVSDHAAEYAPYQRLAGIVLGLDKRLIKLDAREQKMRITKVTDAWESSKKRVKVATARTRTIEFAILTGVKVPDLL